MKQMFNLTFNLTKPLTSKQIEELQELTEEATGIFLCMKGPTRQIKGTYTHGVDLLDIAGFFMAVFETEPNFAYIMMERMAESLSNPDSIIVTEGEKGEK